MAERRWGTLLAQCTLNHVLVLFADGRWDDALAEIDAGPEPHESWAALPLYAVAAIIAVHRDELLLRAPCCR